MKTNAELVGVRVYNGVTENVNPNGMPIYLHDSINPRKSDFSVLFKPIIDKNKDMWAFSHEPDLWRIPEDWLPDSNGLIDETVKEDVNAFYNSGFICREPLDGLHPTGYMVEGKRIRDYYFAGVFTSEYMRRYSILLRNEWNELITLQEDISDYSSTLKYFGSKKGKDPASDKKYLKRHASRWFYNFDGIFWWFFTRDVSEISDLKTHLSSYPKARIEEEPEFNIKSMKNEYMNL